MKVYATNGIIIDIVKKVVDELDANEELRNDGKYGIGHIKLGRSKYIFLANSEGNWRFGVLVRKVANNDVSDFFFFKWEDVNKDIIEGKKNIYGTIAK